MVPHWKSSIFGLAELKKICNQVSLYHSFKVLKRLKTHDGWKELITQTNLNLFCLKLTWTYCWNLITSLPLVSKMLFKLLMTFCAFNVATCTPSSVSNWFDIWRYWKIPEEIGKGKVITRFKQSDTLTSYIKLYGIWKKCFCFSHLWINLQ